MAKIAPTRAAAEVSGAKLAALVPAIKDVLTAAIAAGGSTLRDFLSPEGDLGYFAKDWRVYGRAGEACRCGGAIGRLVQRGRSTFSCPQCPPSGGIFPTTDRKDEGLGKRVSE